MRGKLLLPLSADESQKSAMKDIVGVFKDSGHSIDSKVLETEEKSILEQDEKGLLNLHRKIQRELKAADFVVAEISQPSSGIGYLISQAISERRPVLALMKKSAGAKRAPIPFASGSSKLINFKYYSDRSDLEEIAVEFLKVVKDQIDTKFILIISPEIDKYLEWTSTERRMHKAQVVRNAIEAQMSKDKEYKEFQKSIE